MEIWPLLKVRTYAGFIRDECTDRWVYFRKQEGNRGEYGSMGWKE